MPASIIRRSPLRRLRRAVPLALAALLACAAVALAAHPLNGGKYAGKGGAYSVRFRVTGDGKALSAYFFQAHIACQNGASGQVHYKKTSGEPSIKVDGRGQFSVGKSEASSIRSGKAQVKGTYTDTIAGTFTSARTATGSIRIRFRSRNRKLNCDTGRVEFKAQARR